MEDFEAELERDLPRGVPGMPGTLTEANWLDPAELGGPDWAYRDSKDRLAGVLLGYRDSRVVGSLDNRHVLTVAGSRGGKGVSLIIPNLLSYEGSVLAIDPKGELARITARARIKKFQKVVILDPFEENGSYPTGKFNPLDELDSTSDTLEDDAGLVADALITPNERDPHWTDSARNLVKALILFTLSLDAAERNLVTVRSLLMLTHPKIADLARRNESKDLENQLFLLLKAHGNKVVSGTGNAFASTADRERASIFSTARTQTEFLDSPKMEKVLTGSDLKLSELKTGKTTLYLCLPATRMGTHARWLRVIINLAIVAFERAKVATEIPVLVVLDEFPVLGHMKSVETAAGLMAGFGVKLWVVLQDLTQIKRLYKDSWETFIGNAGVMTFFANTDHTTLDYVSQKLGQTGVRLQQPSGATAGARLAGSSATREELRVQRLAAPDELERLLARQKRRLLVKAAGQAPVILQRIHYYQDDPFAGQFDL